MIFEGMCLQHVAKLLHLGITPNTLKNLDLMVPTPVQNRPWRGLEVTWEPPLCRGDPKILFLHNFGSSLGCRVGPVWVHVRRYFLATFFEMASGWHPFGLNFGSLWVTFFKFVLQL